MDWKTLRPGTVLVEKFVIEGKLGDGGMAAIYAVREANARQAGVMALKAVNAREPKLFDRLLAEYETLRHIHHPNIVHVHEWGVDSEAGVAFFVMDHVPGLPFTEFIKTNWLSLGDTLELFKQVLYAVTYLHRQGVTHRDLKPTNILVSRDGQVTMVDFGICRSPQRTEITDVGDFTGTLLFVSPEQAAVYLAGEQSDESLRALATGPRADVYALGVLLYHLLTKEWPHRQPAHTVEEQLEFLHRVRHLRPRPPNESSSSIPPTLAKVAMAMLNPYTHQRPATAEHVAPTFEAALKADADHLSQLSPLVKPEFERAMHEDGLAPTQPSASPEASITWRGVLSYAMTAAAAAALTLALAPASRVTHRPATVNDATVTHGIPLFAPAPELFDDMEPGSTAWGSAPEEIVHTADAATPLQQLILRATLITGPLLGQRRYPCDRSMTAWKGACWRIMVVDSPADPESIKKACGNPKAYEPDRGYCVRTHGLVYVPVYEAENVKPPTATIHPDPKDTLVDSNGYK